MIVRNCARMKRYASVFVVLAAIAAVHEPSAASSFADRIAAIAARPAFAPAQIGIEFFDLDANRAIFSRNAAELFSAASTTKVVTEAATLHALGARFRIHTRVFRTGPIDGTGTL